jgi:2-polyprenyl-6-methoxyphenol hydroxylase-like FAD-dependent oxidoreductase
MAWRDFAYSHSVTGTQLGRIDQFANTPIDFWNASPANVIHLAQNKLETLLRAQLIDSSDSYNTVGSKTFFGYEVTECTHTSSGSQIQLRSKSAIKDEHNFHCKYLVAADGANSFIRRSLGIPLEGEDSMQSLVNVHFTCKGLRELLTPRSAMLYFVYNEAMVGVFVAHDPQADEWVCQIPFFPPFQSAKVRCTRS